MNPRKPIALLAATTLGAVLVLAACSSTDDPAVPVTRTPHLGDPLLAFDGPVSESPTATLESSIELAKPDPDETKAAWREGLALFESRDYAEAASRLEVAVLGRSEDAYTHYLLGLARLKSDDPEGAESALARSAELDPTRVKTFVNLARARMSRGDPQGAQNAAEVVIQIDPDNVAALHQLGRALAARNRTGEAIATLAHAHELAPEDGYVANTYGWVLLMAGRTDDAVPLLEIAKRKLPDVAYVRNNLGVAYERLGRREDAAVEYVAAVDAGDPEGKAAESLARVNAILERLAATKPEAPVAIETARN